MYSLLGMVDQSKADQAPCSLCSSRPHGQGMLSPPKGHPIGRLHCLETEPSRPLFGQARALWAHGRPWRSARRPPQSSLLGCACAIIIRYHEQWIKTYHEEAGL